MKDPPLHHKYIGKSYREIHADFVFPTDRMEYNHVDTEGICNYLRIPYNYYDCEDYEVPFLWVFESGLNWRCTDTQVGLYWLYYKDAFGPDPYLVGVMEQPARKSDKEYSFFTENHYYNVHSAVSKFVRPKPQEPILSNFESGIEKCTNYIY